MSETRLTPDVDLDGVSPDEAFAVLGDETRLDIIRVLWKSGALRTFEDGAEDAETMTFSELRDLVDVEDTGRFNYHLSKLVPHFVRGTDTGYRLSEPGKRIARTVVAVSGVERLDVTTDLDDDCPFCGGSLTASYEDQWLRVRCDRCDGIFGDEAPEGTIFLTHYPSGGFDARTPEEAVSTGLYRCILDIAYMMHGICRECADTVSASVRVCEDHAVEREAPCDACGTPFRVWADLRCDRCGFAKRLPVEAFTMGLTPVIGFLEEHGVDVLATEFVEMVGFLGTRFETSVSEDPFRARVSVDGDGTGLTVSLDRGMNVVDVQRCEQRS